MESTNLTIAEIGHRAAQKGMNVSEVTAMPELDSYRYDGKPALICSNMVAWMWKAGGLFAGMDINANEFTPFNVYEINLFDIEWMPPAHC